MKLVAHRMQSFAQQNIAPALAKWVLSSARSGCAESRVHATLVAASGRDRGRRYDARTASG